MMRVGAYLTMEAALVLPEVFLIIMLVISMWLSKTDFCLECQNQHIAKVSAEEQSVIDNELVLRVAGKLGEKDGQN